MSVFDLARVVVYRFHEKGLEFFLVNPDLDQDPDAWKIPDGEMHGDISQYTHNGITLDHTNSDAQPADPVRQDQSEAWSYRPLPGPFYGFGQYDDVS